MTAPVFQSFSETKLSVAGTSIVINKPSSTVADDDLLFVIAVDADSGSQVTGPDGNYVLLQGTRNAAISCYVIRRRAAATPNATHTFTWTNTKRAYGFCLRIDGQSLTQAINISALTTGTSASPTCPTVTTTKEDCLLLRVFGADGGAINVDSGYPPGYNGITVDKTETTVCGGAAWINFPNADATGTAAFSLTASQEWIAVTVAYNSPEGPSASISSSPSASPSISSSPSATVSASISSTPSSSVSASVSSTISPSISSTPSASISSTSSASISASISSTPSASISSSPSASLSVSSSVSASASSTPSVSASVSASVSSSPSTGTDNSIDTTDFGVYTSGGTAQQVTSRFTNLSHLEGETVAIQGTTVDDVTSKYDEEVVSSGVITISTNAENNLVRKAVVGLPITPKLRPMRVVFNTGQGSTMGSVTRISEIVVSFYNTSAAQYGLSMTTLKDITFDSIPFTGDKVLTFDGGFDPQSDLFISSDSPLTLTVRALIPRIYKAGR